MAQISLRQFLPLVLPVAPECPEPVATFNLRLSAIEFCERTRCWRHVTTQTLTQNDSVVVAPDYATIHLFEQARMGGLELTPIAYTDLTQSELTAEGAPRHVTQVGDNRVSVIPYQDGDLTLSLFLKPRFGQDFTNSGDTPVPGLMQDYFDQVPDFLLHQHGETIAEGALARIFDQPAASYHNPARAQGHRARFNERAVHNFSQHLRGQQRSPVRTKTAWF